jgi:predicted ATPase
MITRFEASNFRCLKKVSVALTPLHAFIGPNDSGKSTLLQGILNIMKEPQYNGKSGLKVERSDEKALWTGASLFRFAPDALRRPSALIPDQGNIQFTDDRGSGLAGIYDAILSRGDEAFRQIAAQVRKHFPSIKSLRLKAVSQSEKIMETELLDGTRVPASHFSEGLLYYLAFAALPYLGKTETLLIEEPENGLHPSRIAEVVRVLRAVVKECDTQVLMATHSPLVINELLPEEVTLVTRIPAEGTRLTPMTQTTRFAERSKVYALGELWLSYANGSDEAQLVGKDEPA